MPSSVPRAEVSAANKLGKACQACGRCTHTRALAEERGELRVEKIREGLLEEVTADFLRMSRSWVGQGSRERRGSVEARSGDSAF